MAVNAWTQLQKELNLTMEYIAEQIHRGTYQGSFLPDIFALNQEYYHKLIDKRYPSSIGTDLNKQLKANVDRFLAGKNYDQWNELMDMRTQNLTASLDEIKMFSKSINNLYNSTWAKTETDFMGNAMEVAKRMDTYENLDEKQYVLEYVATNDELTRDSHRALDGVRYPKSHPFWHDHMPPWDYNCRCSVKMVKVNSLPPDWSLQTSKKVADANLSTVKEPAGLNKNIRKDGKFFNNDHPYIKNNNVDYVLGQLKRDLGQK